MVDVSAVAIREISGSQVTEDGQNMLIKTIQSDGNELILAIPRSEILKLADVSALSQKQSDEILKIDPAIKPVFRVSWWELGFDKSTGTVMLTLTFGAGGKLSFQLWGDMPKALLDTLQVHVGGNTLQKPDILN
ncbi:MAG: hypothetical protein PHW76_03405 [Alphaproteobacteria bacterium]|nr:hypothetical protein [Alphaproteobacteria bacterium]